MLLNQIEKKNTYYYCEINCRLYIYGNITRYLDTFEAGLYKSYYFVFESCIAIDIKYVIMKIA